MNNSLAHSAGVTTTRASARENLGTRLVSGAGECKSWTVDRGRDRGRDCGLDHGLDRGLDYGRRDPPN